MTTNTTYSVRLATEDDLDAIVAIENQVHAAPWSRDHFLSELSKSYSQFWVLTDDETDEIVVGYLVFWQLFDESEILNIAIGLPYRGLGFAKKLIAKAIAHSVRKGLKKLTLEVRKSNEAAIHLYQRLGFAITRVRKDFYPAVLTQGKSRTPADGLKSEDAYQMEVDLQG